MGTVMLEASYSVLLTWSADMVAKVRFCWVFHWVFPLCLSFTLVVNIAHLWSEHAEYQVYTHPDQQLTPLHSCELDISSNNNNCLPHNYEA